MKKFSMSNSVKSLGCIKYYSLSSPRLVQSPSNCIRHNCQKICRWSRRSKTILEIRKNTTFLKKINKPIIYKFFKDANNHRKKNNKAYSVHWGLNSPQKHHPSFLPSPPLLNQETFQAHPFLGNLPTSILVFREPPPPP